MSDAAPEKTRHWLAPILVALIGAFMSILDTSIVNIAIPTIMGVFNAGTTDAQWVVTAYLLALGVVVPLSGWLGDRFGFKRLYIFSMAIFVLGSLLCTMSWSLTSLITARVIQALGGGLLMPTTMSMVFRMVPRDKFGAAMGIFGLSLLVAPAIGPTLGGYLVEYVDWRWIFTINLPIGVVGILLSIAILPDFGTKKVGRLDIGGALTAAGGLFALLLALSKGSDWGWHSEGVIILFYLSFALLALFAYIELTSKDPLLDLRVFKYPAFTFANLTIVITTIGMYAGLFYIPLFLQTIRGLGALQTGLLMMPGALASAVTMPIVGRLYDKIGPRVLVIFGLMLLALLTFDFHYINLQTSWGTITLWVVLRGLVMAFANMPAQTSALADIPEELIGRASAMTNIITRVSSSFGIAILTTILTHRTAVHSAQMHNSLTAWNPEVLSFFSRFAHATGETINQSRTAAIAYLQGLVAKQAFVRGIDDVFLIAAGLTVFGIIPALFLKRAERPGPGAAAE